MSNCGSNSQPYRLDAAQREAFRRDAFIKLAHVLSPAVVRRLAERLDSLLRAEHSDDVAARFIALEQLWLHDEVMRLVAFPRGWLDSRQRCPVSRSGAAAGARAAAWPGR